MASAIMFAGGSLPALAAEVTTASTEPSADESAVVEDFFSDLDISDAKTAEAVSAFEALSRSEQDHVIEVLQSDTPMDVFTLGQETSSTRRARLATGRLTTAGRDLRGDVDVPGSGRGARHHVRNL